GEFSKKTDVWSFGVLIWEIFTRCSSDPFPHQTNAEAKAKILSGKQPMELPKGTPPKIVQAMSICFTQNPEERPDFEPLFRILAPNEQPPAPMDMWDTYVA
ncbi:Inactive tyrosine-protein kinase 7, partial [Toxocara canis]